jgi:hypothetical protein
VYRERLPRCKSFVNPLLRRGSPIHDAAFLALRNLQADDVSLRSLVFRIHGSGLQKLAPPTADHTFWDFSLIDPLVLDFLDATHGHAVVLNFSTIPQWMFRTEKPVVAPSDPNEVDWSYETGD